MREVILIDLRDMIDYKNKHMKNSKNMDYDELMFEPHKYLDKNKKYCFCCEKGIRSLKLSKYLNNIGYTTYSIKGGYNS